MTIADSKAKATGFLRSTLCFLRDNNRILLAMKKRGFGVGKWNGVGGKVKDGESVYEAMVRETFEEVGVTVKESQKVAELVFYNYDGSNSLDANMLVDVYIATAWDGDPIESDEMAPKWFDLSNLPYDQMWSDDRYWLPEILKGRRVRFSALFSGDGEQMEEHLIENY